MLQKAVDRRLPPVGHFQVCRQLPNVLASTPALADGSTLAVSAAHSATNSSTSSAGSSINQPSQAERSAGSRSTQASRFVKSSNQAGASLRSSAAEVNAQPGDRTVICIAGLDRRVLVSQHALGEGICEGSARNRNVPRHDGQHLRHHAVAAQVAQQPPGQPLQRLGHVGERRPVPQCPRLPLQQRDVVLPGLPDFPGVAESIRAATILSSATATTLAGYTAAC